MRRLARCVAWVSLVLSASVGCRSREQPPAARSDSVVTADAADTGIVQERADWAAFVAGLPSASTATANALERYRREHGVPFEFFVRRGVPDSVIRALRVPEDEMGCGSQLTAFVRRMPSGHPVLMELPAFEFDSAGRILRRWPLPGESGFYEIVGGVVGDEIILSYSPVRGMWARIKPNGDFMMSADRPPPLEPEQWIEVADSVWVRVRPKDDGTFSTYPSGVQPDPLGTWVPSGDSGWYVRTDSVPGRRSVARAVTKEWEPRPRLVTCPPSSEFEGMVCRGFPEGGREHRIAYPMPCS